MKNLAGHPEPDSLILDELRRVGIPAYPVPRVGGEVAFGWIGLLHKIEFTRAWYYWIACGRVPLRIANRLYSQHVTRTDVRIAGHCGCPPPEPPWLEFRTADGREVVHDPSGKQEREWDGAKGLARKILDRAERPVFARNAFAVATDVYVSVYHIDSELGLHLFVEAIDTDWKCTGERP